MSAWLLLAVLAADRPLVRTLAFQAVEHPTEGPMTMLGIPVSYSATPASIRRLAPRLGEHTHEVLREAGLSPDEIIAATTT